MALQNAPRCGVSYLADDLEAPVLVVSSLAGRGNHSAGAEIARRIGVGREARHEPIERLISARQVRSHFDRHRWICLNAPWMLHVINGLPLSYRLKLLRESRGDDADARAFGDRVTALGARTIIAVNHRAALWLAALRRRGRLHAKLWTFMTDYALSEGWRHQLWSEVERAFGPAPEDDLPRELRARYRRVEMPVREGFAELAVRPGAVDEVLLCGGGYGLGELPKVSVELARMVPWLTLHVACGDNPGLLATMRSLRTRFPNVRAYPYADGLDTIMARCASVITKPGGLTLAESHAARRTLFLLDGLPGVERKNHAHAVKHMGARDYSLPVFARWASERRASAQEISRDG